MIYDKFSSRYFTALFQRWWAFFLVNSLVDIVSFHSYIGSGTQLRFCKAGRKWNRQRKAFYFYMALNPPMPRRGCCNTIEVLTGHFLCFSGYEFLLSIASLIDSAFDVSLIPVGLSIIFCFELMKRNVSSKSWSALWENFFIRKLKQPACKPDINTIPNEDNLFFGSSIPMMILRVRKTPDLSSNRKSKMVAAQTRNADRELNL